MKKLLTLLLVSATGLVGLLVVTSPPAAAGETRYLSTQALIRDGRSPWANPPHPYNGGFAEASLNVTFPGKRVVDVQGFVNDVCNSQGKGDGYAASLAIRIGRKNNGPAGPGGTKVSHIERNIVDYRDSRTCSRPRLAFDPGPFSFPRKRFDVSYLKARLCSYTHDSRGRANWFCVERKFDNWRVRG